VHTNVINEKIYIQPETSKTFDIKNEGISIKEISENNLSNNKTLPKTNFAMNQKLKTVKKLI